MSFEREKRRLLGWLALVAPLPLPLNQVLEWPVLFLYLLAVIYFLQRAERPDAGWLSDWALNLLGLVYFPIFFFDFRLAFLRGSPVRALLHLIMFLVVVKLFAIRRERDKWHLMMAIFFLFVGAMATSSHVSVGIYLLGFLALGLLALGILAYLHVLAAFGLGGAPGRGAIARLAIEPGRGSRRSSPFAPPPARGPLVVVGLLVVALAIPLFAALPRVREPFILGRGTGAPGMGRTTGFSDSVDLSLTTTIRSNRNVALRIEFSRSVAEAAELRFKGASFDRYGGRSWHRNLQDVEVLNPGGGRRFRLVRDERRVAGEARIYLEPIGSNSVILPVETLAVTLDAVRLVGLDPGGAVLLPPGLERRETLRYDVELARQPVIAARLDPEPESPLAALDLSGVTPRMAELARELMGAGSEGERIDRLERALASGWAYTVDFVGREGSSPLEDFLFVHKSGHCELFASAMVLMLRSEGIPARFVTGFLGAELNPIEGYYVVRQGNAHAWVEAYTRERGWRVYDPTPPEGRPEIATPSLGLLLSQLYDFVNFRWDRYVLTYGADDQRGVFASLRQLLGELWQELRRFGRRDPAEEKPLSGPYFQEASDPDDAVAERWRLSWAGLGWMFLVFATAAAWIVLRRRPPPSGGEAYHRLRRRLARAGLELPPALPPLALARLAAGRYPAATEAVERLVGLYLRESFGGEELASGERQRLRLDLRAVAEVVRES